MIPITARPRAKAAASSQCLGCGRCSLVELPAAMLATILFQSGLNYSREKMDDAAKAAYQRCVRDYPNTPAAAEARKLLGKT